MELFLLLKANIRHQKSSFLGILILMFLVSLALTSVLTVYINSSSRVTQALKEDGYGEMVIELYSDKAPGGDLNALIENIKKNQYVDSVKTIPVVYAQIADLNGKKSGTVILQPEKQDCFNFQIFNNQGTHIIKNQKELKPGEVSVPISYQSLYDCKIGDNIIFESEGQIKQFTVKSFLEDPFCGSSMMGVKNLLMNNSDLKQLYDLAKDSKKISQGMLLNVFKNKNTSIHFMEFERSINETTDVGGYARGTLGIEESKGYMLITTNIFCGVLVSFVILLLIVALIVINHSISSSIDLEYINLGILKAVGFSQGKIKIILALQYLSAALLGVILGIPIALPIISYLGKTTTPVTGFLVSDQLPIYPIMGATVGILLLIVIFVSVKLRKITGITPIQAIRNGHEDIYFANRLEIKIRKKGMNIFLAFRQLTSNYRQYLSAGIITALLVFFLVMVSNLSSWVGKDGNGLVHLFTCFDSDIEINYKNSGLQREVEGMIESENKITGNYQTYSSYLLINGCKVLSFMCTDAENYNTVLEGRTCRYDNEILITQFIAKELNLNIGDTVILSGLGKKANYMVSGIYQSGSDMGKNIALNEEGFGKIVEPEEPYYNEYKLLDSTKAKDIVEKLKLKYGNLIMVQNPADELGGIDSIVAAINGLMLLVYGISVVFVVIVIFLQCDKIFAKERKDYGIYKSLGFTSSNLRIQFALRFFFVSIISGLIGAILSIMSMNQCLEFMLSFMGISKFNGHITLIALLTPVIFMGIVFFAFSYLLSGRIKRVDPRILISE